jgi:2-polyprenyl-3-methyl-5-hydroxy-6-metoxy-1,4-benzoquinol methylase
MAMKDRSDDELARSYYLELAAAFVRQRLPDLVGLPPAALFRHGLEAGLRLHHFKRTAGLPRVRKVLGILRGLAPAELLDVGSGRGVFLWPLVDSFPGLRILSIDRKPMMVADVQAVHLGGIDRLHAAVMDVHRLALADDSVDVVTFLEVLEHLPQPGRALAEAVRVARRFVVVSVPAHEDDNPEHIHLFTRQSLTALFAAVGVTRLSFDAVLNHRITVARVNTP